MRRVLKGRERFVSQSRSAEKNTVSPFREIRSQKSVSAKPSIRPPMAVLVSEKLKRNTENCK